MSPVYLNPQTSSPIPFLELKGDQQHGFQVFGHVEKLVLSHEKASDLGQQPYSSWLQSTIGDNSGCSYGYSFNFQEEEKIDTEDQININNNNHNNKYYSKKWKPSKVRIMQKMMATSKNSGNNSKQQLDHHDLGNKQQQRQNNDGIRVCSDCHTTTTPLWRSGPQGPKSLCNACGIRQRKARRAAMAAAAAAGFGNDTVVTPPMPPIEARKSTNKAQEIKAEKGLLDQDKNLSLPIKKRSKIIDATNENNSTHNSQNNNAKKHCFEDFALSSNKDNYLNPNLKRSFPRDEEEGAILLMALSCGLACSS
ncbi:putative GATA transcription factor 22 [Bienertia sinuspersici]